MKRRITGPTNEEMVSHIVKRLADGKPHKAGSIAFDLGVCTRTIRRAIHHMRDELGLPIVTGRYGFYFCTSLQTNEVNLFAKNTPPSSRWTAVAEGHGITDYLPEPFVSVAVHCRGFSCLAYLDNQGIWRGHYDKQPLSASVVSWEPI
jgi:hypothetical protein